MVNQFENNGRTRPFGKLISYVAFPSLAAALTPTCGVAAAADTEKSEVRKELRALRAQMDKDRHRMEEDQRTMEEDRQRIEKLQRQVEQIQSTDTQRVQQLEQKNQALEQKFTLLETQASSSAQRNAFNQYVDRFVGNQRFTLVGDFAVDFTWNDRTHTNSFVLENFAPIFLYQASDRLLFEGEVEFLLSGTESEVPELEFAQADYVINDYITLVAGKFLLPFGDYIERYHQKWIRKLVDRPLMYRPLDQGGIMQDTGVGVQLRGAIPLGYGDGTYFEYSAYVIDGPRYDSDEPGAFYADNHVDNNQGKGVGIRLGVNLLPVDLEMGILHLSASTLDGTWDSKTGIAAGDNHWLTSWGVGFDYQLLPFQFRGEYLSSTRGMPAPFHDDKREGWYLEASYLLDQFAAHYLSGSDVGYYIGRTELVSMWSAVNQNQIAAAADAFTAFSRKPREVAVGLDYWIQPKVVAKFEYRRVLQDGHRDFNGLLTSFVYGF